MVLVLVIFSMVGKWLSLAEKVPRQVIWKGPLFCTFIAGLNINILLLREVVK